MKRQAGALLLAAALSVVTGRAAAQDEQKGLDRVRGAAQGTVRIITGVVEAGGEFRGKASGSGVLVSEKGLVLTNRHVVFPAEGREPYPSSWAGIVDPKAEFHPPQRAVRLKLLHADPAVDLALLQMLPAPGTATSFPAVKLARGSDLSYGSRLTLIGFPTAGGPTVTAVPAIVVGLDAAEGWLKVEGSLMHGLSGGAAVDARGELVGIPTMVVSDPQVEQQVPFWGDSDMPVGTITLGQVGFVRSLDAVRRFLATFPAGPWRQEISAPPVPSLRVTGTVKDAATGRPVAGALVAFLAAGTSRPTETPIRREDLVAWARTGSLGEYTLDKRVAPGPYLMKVLHEQYTPLWSELSVDPANTVWDITLKKE